MPAVWAHRVGHHIIYIYDIVSLLLLSSHLYQVSCSAPIVSFRGLLSWIICVCMICIIEQASRGPICDLHRVVSYIHSSSLCMIAEGRFMFFLPVAPGSVPNGLCAHGLHHSDYSAVPRMNEYRMFYMYHVKRIQQ